MSKKLRVTQYALIFYAALAAAGVAVGVFAPTAAQQVVGLLQSIGSSVATPLMLYLTGQSAVDAVGNWRGAASQPKV